MTRPSSPTSTEDATSSDSLARLPLDIIFDHLIPLLDVPSILNLALVNKAYHASLSTDELIWQRMASREFNFPVADSGRRTGWLHLYKQLTKTSCYVWGTNENGRLGPANQCFAIRNRLISSGLVIPTRLELPSPPISLVASGWSFAAIASHGGLVFWGTVDASVAWSPPNAPLSAASKQINRPILHPRAQEMGEIVQLSAGRGHFLARNNDGEVYEMRSVGRTAQITDSRLRWGRGSGNEVAAVESSWEYSLVLTTQGEVYIWHGAYELFRKGDAAAAEAGEGSLRDPEREGVVFPLEVKSLKLPHLPPQKGYEDEGIIRIAAGDTFVIALTSESRLFWYSLVVVEAHLGRGLREPVDLTTQQQASLALEETLWVPMSAYYDSKTLRAVAGLEHVRDSTKITHISAHFKSFCAYSVPATRDPAEALVLLGTDEWDETISPTVIPKLQRQAIIKVSHGDYHSLALTSDGRILSWGAYSNGALGLGHPQLLDTPLSAPHPPPSPASAAPVQLPPPTRTGPIIRRDHGFTPGRAGQRIPNPPDSVDTPTKIRFAGEEADETIVTGQPRAKGKFVFDITASGWHSGCLAVDLGSDEEEPTIKSSEGRPSSQGASGPKFGDNRENDQSRGGGPAMFGGRVFRIGFAGRGMARNPQA